MWWIKSSILADSTWFAWQGFGSEQATGMAPIRRHQKLSPYPTQPMPDGSKMDLDKAELVSDGGNTPVIMYLRSWKKLLHNGNCSKEREVRKCERQLCRHQNQWRRRGRSAPGTGAEVLLQFVLKSV